VRRQNWIYPVNVWASDIYHRPEIFVLGKMKWARYHRSSFPRWSGLYLISRYYVTNWSDLISSKAIALRFHLRNQIYHTCLCVWWQWYKGTLPWRTYFNRKSLIFNIFSVFVVRFKWDDALRSNCSDLCTAWEVSLWVSLKPVSQLRFDYDTTTIRRYHDAFDYDESDRNYDVRSIRLQYDYVATTTKN